MIVVEARKCTVIKNSPLLTEVVEKLLKLSRDNSPASTDLFRLLMPEREKRDEKYLGTRELL